mgnify:CR=1 FL=1
MLGLLVGGVMALTGAGGGVLAAPLLMLVLHLSPSEATPIALVAVGAAAWLGAWLGWPALVSLVLIASLTGVAGGLLLRARGQLGEDGYIPFGPFLAFAGLWVMVWGPLPGLQL